MVVALGRYDAIKWFFLAVLLAAGVYGNYYFSDEMMLYRALGLLVIVACSGVVLLQTIKGRALWELTKEAKQEIRKVVWPSRQETVQTTLVVVVVVLIMGLILWALDSLLGWMVSSLIG